ILLGNGDSTFQPPTTVRTGKLSSTDAVAGDFNGDGRADLAVAGFDVFTSASEVSVLLGNGDGTFPTPVQNAVGNGPAAIVAGDFNGDGRVDLAVANSLDSALSVLLGNGDGTFQPAQQYAVGLQPIAIVAGDFNGDGRIDLAVVDIASNDVSILLGNGDGTFQPAGDYSVGGAPDSLSEGDFNGDARLCLA